MMKANELRIGNWVRKIATSEDTQIFALGIVSHAQCDMANQNWEYEPISLTPEWLERFGFENSNNLKKSDSFFFVCVGASELHINPDNGVVWIERGDNIFNNPALVTHVHQLQNLYFALTGEELELR